MYQPTLNRGVSASNKPLKRSRSCVKRENSECKTFQSEDTAIKTRPDLHQPRRARVIISGKTLLHNTHKQGTGESH